MAETAVSAFEINFRNFSDLRSKREDAAAVR